MKTGFLIALVAAAFLWVAYYNHSLKQEKAAPTVTSTGEALIGGDFTLIDTRGKTVTSRDFDGKLRLVFFGFTHCPDICPATLGVIDQVMKELGEDAIQVTPIFITVDPERDTPAVMADYLRSFDAPIVGLTGSQQQVEAVQKAYRVYVTKEASKNGGKADDSYMVNHSSLIYLMGRNGEYLTHFSGNDTAKGIVTLTQEYLNRHK